MYDTNSTIANGYICGSCGGWVSYGNSHYCGNCYPMFQQPLTWPPPNQACTACNCQIIRGSEHTITHKTANGLVERHYCQVHCPDCHD